MKSLWNSTESLRRKKNTKEIVKEIQCIEIMRINGRNKSQKKCQHKDFPRLFVDVEESDLNLFVRKVNTINLK